MSVGTFGSRRHRRIVFLLSALSAKVVPFLKDGTAGIHHQHFAVRIDMREVLGAPTRGSWCSSQNWPTNTGFNSLVLSRSSLAMMFESCGEQGRVSCVLSRGQKWIETEVVTMGRLVPVMVRLHLSPVCAILWQFSPCVTLQNLPRVA